VDLTGDIGSCCCKVPLKVTASSGLGSAQSPNQCFALDWAAADVPYNGCCGCGFWLPGLSSCVRWSRPLCDNQDFTQSKVARNSFRIAEPQPRVFIPRGGPQVHVKLRTRSTSAIVRFAPVIGQTIVALLRRRKARRRWYGRRSQSRGHRARSFRSAQVPARRSFLRTDTGW
jgi:hypothetical protein